MQADSDMLLSMVKELRAKATICGCPSVPVLSVLTINRVQDVFTNPVYTFHVGEQNDSSGRELEDRCLDSNTSKLQGCKDVNHDLSLIHI